MLPQMSACLLIVRSHRAIGVSLSTVGSTLPPCSASLVKVGPLVDEGTVILYFFIYSGQNGSIGARTEPFDLQRVRRDELAREAERRFFLSDLGACRRTSADLKVPKDASRREL